MFSVDKVLCDPATLSLNFEVYSLRGRGSLKFFRGKRDLVLGRFALPEVFWVFGWKGSENIWVRFDISL